METTVKNLSELKSIMAKDSDLQEDFKKNPIDAINKIQQTPLDTDYWIYRIVVISLGITIVSIIIGILVAWIKNPSSSEINLPTILTAIVSAALGALTGLLAPSPKQQK